METLLIVLCVVVFLLGVVIFSPVVVTVDSRDRLLRIRWLSILEYLRPLPGTSGETRLFVFRRQLTQPARKPEARKAEIKTPKRRRRGKQRGKFLMRCLGNSDIRHKVAQQLWKLLKRACSSVSLTRQAGSVSLPDPALNGMLVGALAASGWGERSGVQVDFRGKNSLFLELHFHPHRIFKAFLFFISGLPYRAMFRQWRAASAARPQ